MKAINKFFYALLAFATVGMVACSEDNTYESGAPELEGCYDVYFPDANTLETQGPTGDVSLDPTEATEFTYTVYRNNTDDAIEVPVNITTNTENKFTVEPIKFAEGEDVAEFKVTLLESEIGVTYSFGLSIDDPQYVKQYDSRNSNSIDLSVTRVKWIDVGVCDYTDDLLNGWYGLGIPTLNVQVQVRADSIDEAAFKAALEGSGSDAGLAGIYRMVSPYKQLTGLISGLDIYDANVIIYAQNVNEAYIPLQEVGASITGGAVMIYSDVAWCIDHDETIDSSMYGSIKGGMLTFPVDALLGCPGGSYAGTNTYYANRNGGWSLNIAPALGKYSLVLPAGYEDGDFEFSEVALPEGALFYSESQALVTEPILEKGKPVVNTDDADRDFVSEYGYLYRLVDPYEIDYPIYFGVKLDGTVTVHPDYEDQYTGLTQNGYDVMMAIDAGASTFDLETGLLNLVAEFYTVQGDYYISYGVYNEAISVEAPDFNFAPALDLKSDFSYKDMFTDVFKSEFQDNQWEATLEKGTALTTDGAEAFAEAYGTAYRISDLYNSGYDLYFAAKEDGTVTVPAGYELQVTGVSIYGQPAFVKILKGTMASNGVSLTVAICDATGEAIMPYACTETLYTYVWLDVATGTYTNGLLGDADGNPVPITGRTLQNAEGTNIYRILDFWSYEDYHLVFTWDRDTNKCEVVGTCDTGYYYSGLGGNFHACDGKTGYYLMGYNLTWEQVEAQGVAQPTYDPTTNSFAFPMFYVCWEASKIYTATDTFVLDGAIAVADWENVAVGTFTHTTDFYQSSDKLPFAETNLTLQRFGQTNKYKIVGVAGGYYDIELTYDSTTGAVTVPSQKTGLQYEESNGSMTDIHCGDAWAMLSDWGAASQGYTAEEVYAAYPNSYDAATKTFSFYLGYYDLYGYTYTSVDEGNPTVHTFQITGDAPAASTSAVQASAAEVKTIKTYNRVKKHEVAPRKVNLTQVGVVNLNAHVSTSKSMKSATPVKRSRIVEMAK